MQAGSQVIIRADGALMPSPLVRGARTGRLYTVAPGSPGVVLEMESPRWAACAVVALDALGVEDERGEFDVPYWNLELAPPAEPFLDALGPRIRMRA
jgi:hypothetical protein